MWSISNVLMFTNLSLLVKKILCVLTVVVKNFQNSFKPFLEFTPGLNQGHLPQGP